MNRLDFFIIAPTPFYYNRGCNILIRGEAEALQKKGFRVLVATFQPGASAGALEIKRAPLTSWGFSNKVAATWKKIPAGFFLFFTVLKIIVAKRPKIIYCHLLEGLLIGLVARFIGRIVFSFRYRPLLILDTQGGRVQEMKAYWMIKNPVFCQPGDYLEKILLRCPDITFTSSLAYKEKLTRQKHSDHGTKIIHLPDAISLFDWKNKKACLQKDIEKDKALAKLANCLTGGDNDLLKQWIKEKKSVLVYAGSFTRGKGIIEFINQLVPRLAEKNENIRFLLGGGGISELGISPENLEKLKDKLIVLSDLNSRNLPYFLLLGDLAIDPKLPRTTESSGKILNYMALGLPVICFDQPNNRFFLGENGIYATDENNLLVLLEKALENLPELKAIGEKNYQRAWERFTWDKQVDKIIDYTKEVIRN